MKRTFLFLIVFFTASYASLGQTVSGKIVDAVSSTPIVGAMVYIDQTQIGTISNFDGIFELIVPVGENKLVIDLLGYKKQEITILVSNSSFENLGNIKLNISHKDISKKNKKNIITN